MQYNFSEQNKFSKWRELWTYLARAEMVEESGICDGEGQVEILKAIVGIENRRHQQRRRARDDFLDHSICTYLQSDRNTDHANQNKCIGSHQHRHVDHGHFPTLQDPSCASPTGGNFNSNENITTSMNVPSGQLPPRSFSSLDTFNCSSFQDRNLLNCQDRCQSLRKVDRNSTLPRSRESMEWRDRHVGICSSESGCSTRSSVSDKLDNSTNQTFGSSAALFDLDRYPPRLDDHAPLAQYDSNMEKSTDDETRMIGQRLENLNVAASGSIFSDYENCSSSGSSDKIHFPKRSVDGGDFSLEAITRKPNYDTIGSTIDVKAGTRIVNEHRTEESLNLFDNYTFVSHRKPSLGDVSAKCIDSVPKQVVKEVYNTAKLPCPTRHLSGSTESKSDAIVHDNYEAVGDQDKWNSTNIDPPTFLKSIGAEVHAARQIARNAGLYNEMGCHRVDLIDNENMISVPNLNNDTENEHARFSTETAFRRTETQNKESSNNILHGSEAVSTNIGYQEFIEKYLTVHGQQNAYHCSDVERAPMPNYVQESNFPQIQFSTGPWTMNKPVMPEGQYNLEPSSGSFVNSHCVNALELPNELINPCAAENLCKIPALNSGYTYHEINSSPLLRRMGIIRNPSYKRSVMMRCSPGQYPHISEEPVQSSSSLLRHLHETQNQLLMRSPISIPLPSQNNNKFVPPMQLPVTATTVSPRHQPRMFHKNSYQKSNCKFNSYPSMNNSSEHQAYTRTPTSSFVPRDHSAIMNNSVAHRVPESNIDNLNRLQSFDKRRSFPTNTNVPKSGRPILSRSRIN